MAVSVDLDKALDKAYEGVSPRKSSTHRPPRWPGSATPTPSTSPRRVQHQDRAPAWFQQYFAVAAALVALENAG